MIMMDLRDVLRDIIGAWRVQFLLLPRDAGSMEASSLDFLFRDRLYENFDYASFASGIMKLVPEDNVIDYKDDFGLHYLVFPVRDNVSAAFAFCGPYVTRARTEEDYSRLLTRLSLRESDRDAIRWYFKRVPVISDPLSWQNMLTSLLARYLANPGLQITPVSCSHPETVKRKPSLALSSIPFSSIEARYQVENAMLEAVRHGDISEAQYQQNLFRSFTLDPHIPDLLRDGKNMVIAVNTALRKTIERAAVHPLYIDGISAQFVREIESTESLDELETLVPRMIRHYCLLVQKHSLEKYSASVRDCLNYIDFHYMEPLSLEGLASRFSVNKNYLSGRFHKESGMTVTDYINQIRIKRAVALMSSTSASMQDIAVQCGFEDANYFSRIFKKIHGETPREYRKSLGNTSR